MKGRDTITARKTNFPVDCQGPMPRSRKQILTSDVSMKRLPHRPNPFLGRITVCVLAFTLTGSGDALSRDDAAEPAEENGVVINDPRAFQGYTLFSPINSTMTFLIDMNGRIVRTWKGASTPCSLAYLLPNGNLLRPCHWEEQRQTIVAGMISPNGGRIQEFTWDGDLVFDMMAPADEFVPHHDIVKLHNGNLLVLASERKKLREVAAAGRRVPGALWSDLILEIKPTGKTAWEVVWKWRTWDHLIQDHDREKPNYGEVEANPGRIDVNFGLGFVAANPAEMAKLKSLGYVGGKVRTSEHWNHINSLDYRPDVDQIMVSVRSFSEVWVIDHGTTTVEAAGSTGGRSGKGGDLLYRWGNPAAYHAARVADQQFFQQHHAHWIPPGRPGAGNMLVFNNGNKRTDGEHSTVDELVLPMDTLGRYARGPKGPFGPDKPVWSYASPNKTDFYSFYVSGAQRLPNGNTLICSGAHGTFFEVTAEKEVVWKYVNPLWASFSTSGGSAAARDRCNHVFRAYRYAADYPGLLGKDLTPGMTVEAMLDRGR